MFRQITITYCAKFVKYFILFLLLTSSTFASNWYKVAPGIEYTDIGFNLFIPWSHIHAFKIDLKYNQLESLPASSLTKENASANEFAYYSKALISINGGFFDEKHRSLGLRISQKKQYNPAKNISWWSVFYIENDIPYIKKLSAFANKNAEFAIQSGPRLIINGRVPSLKPGIAERTALGITKDNKIIIVVTDNSPMSILTLAHLMKLPPLNCKNALNLDGGSSTQLNAQINSFKLQVPGNSKVSDAIIVRSRQ